MAAWNDQEHRAETQARITATWKVRDWRWLWLRKRERSATIFRGYIKDRS